MTEYPGYLNKGFYAIVVTSVLSRIWPLGIYIVNANALLCLWVLLWVEKEVAASVYLLPNHAIWPVLLVCTGMDGVRAEQGCGRTGSVLLCWSHTALWWQWGCCAVQAVPGQAEPKGAVLCWVKSCRAEMCRTMLSCAEISKAELFPAMKGHTKMCWVLCQAMLSRIMPSTSKPSLAKIYHATQYWSESGHTELCQAMTTCARWSHAKLCQLIPHTSLWEQHIPLHGLVQCSLAQLPSVQCSLAWFSSAQLSTVQHSSAQFGTAGNCTAWPLCSKLPLKLWCLSCNTYSTLCQRWIELVWLELLLSPIRPGLAIVIICHTVTTRAVAQ